MAVSLVQRCIDAGLKMTTQRRIILQIIDQADDHPPVDTIHQRSRVIDSSISVATVYRTLNVLDEFTREALTIRVRRKLNSIDVIDVLTDLFILRGAPAFIRSDNGPEMVAKRLQRWLKRLGTTPVYITPGSPWENGYCESFNGKLRDVRRYAAQQQLKLAEQLQDMNRQVAENAVGGLMDEIAAAFSEHKALVGWLEGLVQGIQATLFAQQMAAQQQLAGMRRGELAPGQAPPGVDARPGTYL